MEINDIFADIDKDGVMSFIKFSNSMLRTKDPSVAEHNERVGLIAKEIAKKMDLKKEEIKLAYEAGLIHDLGKLGVRNYILHKPTKFTPEEREEARYHVVIGVEILKNKKEFNQISEVVSQHHERYDGKGYPKGLKEEEIHIVGKILNVADSFDAMNSKRSFSEKKDKDYILKELESLKYKQWDPEVVDAFLELYKDGTINKIIEDYNKTKLY